MATKKRKVYNVKLVRNYVVANAAGRFYHPQFCMTDLKEHASRFTAEEAANFAASRPGSKIGKLVWSEDVYEWPTLEWL